MHAVARQTKQAAFPVVKQLAGFDFAVVPRLNRECVLDLAPSEFIGQKANVVHNGATRSVRAVWQSGWDERPVGVDARCASPQQLAW